MRSLRNILILFFFTSLANAQEIKKVYTRDLVSIAKQLGIESALQAAWGLPVYRIDSIVAFQLLDHVSDVTFPSRSEFFFRQMSHNWFVDPVKKKTNYFAIKGLNLLMSDDLNSIGKIHSFHDGLIISLIKQKPDSIDKQIYKCYLYCDKLANEYKKNFPSAFSRFIQSFKGPVPIVESYEYIQLNCYKLMWALGKLQSNYFDEKKLCFHNSQLRSWQQNWNILSYNETYRENEPQVINLDREYNSIDEIDFTDEPNLKKILTNFDNNEKCWKYMLINGKSCFLVLGCQYDPLAGHGETYKLEIIEKSKLKITMTTAWIS